MDYENLYSTATKALNTETEINEKKDKRIKELEADRQSLVNFNTKYSILRTELEQRIKELETALKRIAAIDSTNDFTDFIVDIAQEALNKKKKYNIL